MADFVALEPKRSNRSNWLAVLAATLFAWVAFTLFPPFRLVENSLNDLERIYFAPAPSANDKIILIAISEETLATLPYRSPVNRNLLAKIVERAVSARAAGLIIDILFDQATEHDADSRLRDALTNAARRMPTAVAFATKRDGLTDAQYEYLARFSGDIPRGLVNLPQDADDGVVRWRFVARADGVDAFEPGLITAIAAQISSEAASASPGLAPLAYSRLGPGNLAAFISYPAHVIASVPDEWLAGKYLFVGADLPLSDRHRTPFSILADGEQGTIPGVAIHAHGLNQVLSKIALSDTPWWGAPPIALLLAGLVAWLFGLERGLAIRATLSGGILAGYAMAAAYILMRWGQILPLGMPTTAGILTGGICGGREWIGERHRRAFLQNAFSRYVSPSVVRLLIEHPERLRLGGEQRYITYVFTDLAGFTTFTEQHSAQVLVDTLNRYLENMCRIALDHGATIDKIVGDAVVAFFNAPVDQADHAERGVRLALAYDKFSEEYRAELKAHGLELGITRIGIHSGPAIVGNFGGNRFFNYTGHGDTVNTAARMESVNKHLGTRICVSGVTASECKGMDFRPIGTLVLVGKSKGIECFEPLSGDCGNYVPFDAYNAAFKIMVDNDPRAAATFAGLSASYPSDPLAALHARRLAEGENGSRIVMTAK